MSYSLENITTFPHSSNKYLLFSASLEHKNYGQVLHENHNEEDGWTSRPFR